ncbi:cupin-like domain-containing protein [Herbaspirillum sp. LeCh32-8]|uniref:cupin-like domain-containing protein n=1 Tax=Herbaspirillum sp. LeCh32-8 TaxID=2821356 RepID=UPI001AE7BF34|nr:cupin-like domain-containing protein [Herbaspirillum sp. LeCh32-8]MBP0598204.1 cupin-like domain-containing protein [Herbaspirillum sp. LeCh32-8]
MPKPTADKKPAGGARNAARALPPRPAWSGLSDVELAARKLAKEQRDAQVRGVGSINDMREAIKTASRKLPMITEVPRLGQLSAAAFRARAAQGLPFVITGLVGKWPLSSLTLPTLREHFGQLAVRARTGDYINTAFAPDRAMQDMSLLQYLDLANAAADAGALPPYLGNLELRELNALCHWPTWFDKMGPPRFWIGPAGTVTPLHCDYDDNIFAQIWGRKRIWLAPPHHDEFLYPREANAILFGSPFDPGQPDFDNFPLARHAAITVCDMQAGELLYLPAGWYHQVKSMSFSLSANRWARATPLLLGAGQGM